ncbi:MAG: ribose 5-phosphate isomerase B [Candidatus Omnitrophica bacterium]|nr:ribose 5-phosphate isomerase B [Candidatus Omnitrophota bacterium]
MNKKISLACDHRGLEFKNQLKSYLEEKGYEPVDCGTFTEDSCDYPEFMIKAAELVKSGECSRGIGICYTGIGSSIMTNKVKGVRAALCKNIDEAKLTRQHNDSNMLIIGSGFLDPSLLIPMTETWLTTPFEGGRHERRVNAIKAYEQAH